jgi:hypothetical protein
MSLSTTTRAAIGSSPLVQTQAHRKSQNRVDVSKRLRAILPRQVYVYTASFSYYPMVKALLDDSSFCGRDGCESAVGNVRVNAGSHRTQKGFRFMLQTGSTGSSIVKVMLSVLALVSAFFSIAASLRAILHRVVGQPHRHSSSDTRLNKVCTVNI